MHDGHLPTDAHDRPPGRRAITAVRAYPRPLTPDTITGVIELAPIGLLLTDANGTILLVNRQIELMFDHPRQQLTGQPVDFLVPRCLRAIDDDHWASLVSGSAVRTAGPEIALTGLRRDGTEFPVEVGLSRLPSEDGPRTVWLVRDASERLDAGRRLIEAERDRAVADDRRRIAGALLDQVIQRLFAVSLTVQSIHGRTDDPALRDRLTAAVDEIDATIADLRSSVFDLA